MALLSAATILLTFFVHNIVSDAKSPAKLEEDDTFLEGYFRYLGQQKVCAFGRVIVFYENISCIPLSKQLQEEINTPLTYHYFTAECLNETGIVNVISGQANSLITFLLPTHNGKRIVDIAETFYNATLRRNGSLFVHRTHWVLLATSVSEYESLSRSLAYSILDNVAIVLALPSTNELSPLAHTITITPSTLMWRENYRRELEEVVVSRPLDGGGEGGGISSSVSNKCNLFPNAEFKLNGRLLNVAVCADPFAVNRTWNASTGRYVFHGMSVMVLDYLADTLNFTYSMRPITSPDSIGIVERREVDFSTSLWNTDTELFSSNITASYPMTMDTVTGVYRRRDAETDRSMFIFGRFPGLVYVLFAACFVWVVLLYFLISDIIYRKEEKEEDEENEDDGGGDDDIGGASLNPEEEKPRLPSQDDCTGKRITHFQPSCLRPKALSFRFVSRVWTFGRSVINQPNLPSPRHASARVIIAAAGVGNVVLYSLYTSYLTSSFVPPSSNAPFNSFDQMLAVEGVRCGMANNATIQHILANAKGGTLKRLHDTCEKIYVGSWSHTDEVEQGLFDVIDDLPENFVYLGYRSVIESIVRNQPDEYRIMSRDLLTANFGMIFPLHSQLEDLMSLKILWLHNVGLIDKWLQDHRSQTNRTLGRRDAGHGVCRSKSRKKNIHYIITVSDFKWLFILTAIWTVVSALVLVVERMRA